MKTILPFLRPLTLLGLIGIMGLGLSFHAEAKPKHPARHKTRPAPFASQPAVREFILEMHARHGFDRGALQQVFTQTRPLPAVLQAVRPPRDPAVRSWQEYRSRFVEPRRIQRGLVFWQAHSTELQAASNASGVPEEYVVAIIGIESIYGAHTGNFGTLAALATLAFDYPKINPATDAARAALFRRELEALLLLAREAQRNPLSYKGSYAGALGLPQFLPSSVRQYARDGDGDNRIDLENAPADAIASVANFLQQHGWEKNGTVVSRAQIDGEAYTQLIDEGIRPKRKPSELAVFSSPPDNPPNTGWVSRISLSLRVTTAAASMPWRSTIWLRHCVNLVSLAKHRENQASRPRRLRDSRLCSHHHAPVSSAAC